MLNLQPSSQSLDGAVKSTRIDSYPPAIFTEQVINFDMSQFPFATAVLEEFVGVEISDTMTEVEAAKELSEYNHGTVISTWRPGKEDKRGMVSRKQAHWEEKTKGNHNKVRDCKKLCEIYSAFLEHVIAPEMANIFYGRDHEKEEIILVYQFPPTVRLFCSEKLPDRSSENDID